MKVNVIKERMFLYLTWPDLLPGARKVSVLAYEVTLFNLISIYVLKPSFDVSVRVQCTLYTLRDHQIDLSNQNSNLIFI